MEMGIGQTEELRKFITYPDQYVATVEVLKDLAGIERVIVAQRK
jgi:methylase of polypeptide subunit release factors